MSTKARSTREIPSVSVSRNFAERRKLILPRLGSGVRFASPAPSFSDRLPSDCAAVFAPRGIAANGMRMQILRTRDRVSTPWKNGGGSTAEIAVSPAGAGLNDFDWRVSVAQLERGGPFSVFPGIDRNLTLLSGRVSLAIAGRDAVELSPGSPSVEFAGNAETSATIINSPASDLNVMTRHGAFNARVSRRHGAGPMDIDSAVETAIVYFLTDATAHNGGADIGLAAGDALRGTPAEYSDFVLHSDSAFYLIEISAL